MSGSRRAAWWLASATGTAVALLLWRHAQGDPSARATPDNVAAPTAAPEPAAEDAGREEVPAGPQERVVADDSPPARLTTRESSARAPVPGEFVSLGTLPFETIKEVLGLDLREGVEVSIDAPAIAGMFEQRASFQFPLPGGASVTVQPIDIRTDTLTGVRLLKGAVRSASGSRVLGEIRLTELDGVMTGRIAGPDGAYSLLNGPHGQYLVAWSAGARID